MKKNYLIILLVLYIVNPVLSQIPGTFNYQAVVKNSSGEILSNQDISVQVSIYEGNDPGTNLYSETHSVSTNNYGTISISIGSGTIVSGTFAEIDWSTGNKYLKVEIDESGGSSYTNLGMVELLSVPYALSSKLAENLGSENVYKEK